MEKEASFRRFITSGALFALEFDMTTGKRIVSQSDVLPLHVPKDLTLTELLVQLLDLLHPEDRRTFEGHFDIERIRRDLTLMNTKISFDCRAKSLGAMFEGYHWVGITYMYTQTRESGNPVVLIYIVDIHGKKTSQLLLLDMAKRDPLTGLLNRTAFEEYFTALVKKVDDSLGSETGSAAFVMVSIDNFKQIDDAYGHAFGDKLLQNAAMTLRAIQGESAARLEGVKFALSIYDTGDQAALHEKMRILCSALTRKINDDVTLTASIGVAIYPTHGESFDTLYEKADRALYQAIKEGGNQFVFYNPQMDHIRQPIKTMASPEGGERKRIYVRTFGYFDVFVDGQAIPFKLVKAKELLALLVDRHGGFLSASEAISFLWEDDPADELTMARYRKVAMRLKNILAEFGIEGIIESKNGLRRIVPEKIDCDYYKYLSGRPEYRHLFTGAYLTNYSWGESTLSMLTEMGGKP